MPDIAISTDIITGFPGETEKDFKETFNYIKEINFSRLHIFPFSAHKNTPASRFSNQIDIQTKQTRSKILRELGKELTEKYYLKFKGKILDVVIENKNGDNYRGKSEFYFDVNFNNNNIKNIIKNRNLIGKLVKIKLPA